MVNQFGFSCEGDKAVKTILKREFAGKSNTISCNAFIKFIASDVERCIFEQVHKNMVTFFANTQYALKDVGIVYDCQFINLVDIIVQFDFPVEISPVFLNGLFAFRKRKL